jgi:hypothetical protein
MNIVCLCYIVIKTKVLMFDSISQPIIKNT